MPLSRIHYAKKKLFVVTFFCIIFFFFRYLNAYSRTEDDGLNSSSHMDSTIHSVGPLQDDQMEEDLPAAGAVWNIFLKY